MTKQISLNTLWNSATSKDRVFHSDEFAHLPEAAKRYLEHAIAPGTKIADARQNQIEKLDSIQSRASYLLGARFVPFPLPPASYQTDESPTLHVLELTL